MKNLRYNNICLRALTILCLMMASVGAWATDYVFVYNGNYLGVNAAGTGIENYTTFDPARCVWTCVYNNAESTLDGTSRALRITYNGNTRYLNGSTTAGNAPTLATTAQNVWRADGTRVFYRSGYTSYYLYYRGSSWRTSSTGKANNNNGYQSNNGNTDYRATLTASTNSGAVDGTTAPTISCSGLTSTGGGLQMVRNGNLGGTYIPAATTITVGTTTYYKGTNGVYSTTAPSATLNPQYAWSINSGNANITNAGVLTLSNNNTQNVRVRLTITNTNPAITKTVDYNLSATQTAALNTTDYSDITITPSSQTLDLGETVTYEVSKSISQVTKTRPLYVTITDADGHSHYKVGTTYQANEPTITETPGTTLNFTSFSWSAAEGGAYFTLEPYYSASSNEVTLTRSAQKTGTQQTFTISVTGVYGGQNKTASATVTIPATQVDLTALHAGAAINLGVGSSESINGHYTYEPDYDSAGAPYLKFKYNSNNESVATVDASGKVTAVGPGTTTITITAVKLDGTDGVTCDITVNVAIDAPTISIDGSGNVTITHPVPGVQIRYTTDGTDPTATTGTVYSGTFTASNEQTIKAVAVANGVASPVANEFYATSGVSGGKVILNDYEDHTWTYYAGVDSEVDGGHYNTNYVGKLYSPNPRNVKITYNATNGAAVSIDESETTFVYYQTLEQGSTAGQYPYQVISNPFSKRPAHNSTTYYGFNGWKIVSGGEYIQGHNNNDVLTLDEEITFVNLPYPSKNCTSAEIVFETTWTTANRTYITTNPGSNQTYTFNSGTYETNFVVINADYSRQITISGSATIMMVEPDGSANYRGRAFSGALVPAASPNTTKIEFANWQPSADINPQGRNLTIGRGMLMTSGTARRLYGTNTSTAVNQVVKVESGRFSSFYHYGAKPTSITKQIVVYGNDYDRAKNDNSKLNITGICKISSSLDLGLASTRTMMCRTYSKSGQIMSTINVGSGATDNVYYYSPDGSQRSYNGGCRYLEIQGGEWCGIAGGFDYYHDPKDPAFTFRMKGGLLRGPIYGAGEFYSASGIRTYVITGGQIKGWVACGANGTRADGGTTTGESFLYVGGKARIDSEGNNTVINRAVGGNVFGAGCGNSTTSSSGELVEGTNVIVADEAYVERGVYGGGSYGFTTQTSYMYITGGHVAGKPGGVNGTTYDANIQGGVFGGSCQNKGGNAKFYMTGGLIEGGLYGGSNSSGTLSGSVTMQVNGGQVGTSSKTANIHGGGYGNSTIVSRDVEITLGKTGAARDADGVTIWGDVYGGSALGSVNGTAATTTYHTYVTMNAGYIHGSLYGGALGNVGTAANVYGPVKVTVNGGSVFNTDGTGANGSGAVYGANNINGAPQRSVTVDIYGTNSAPAEGEYALFSVYGGGNAADYSHTYAQNNGYPKVTVHNCDNSIEYVYGGGNAAAVAATDVTIYGGDKIGNVFGGGNGQVRAANVTGGTNVKIYGGTIGDVYGGSNTQGTIDGTINVNVNAQAEGGNPACPIDIDNVYGGGNKAASAAGNITIGCAEHIGAVYGGANQANVTGDITLNIKAGNVDNVFGGNNTSGTIDGTITVNINEDKTTYPCGMLVGNVYGGGNKAAYTGNPTVNFINGTSTGSVFGGGLGQTAIVTGNPQVNIGSWTEGTVTIGQDVFGGGDLAAVEGAPVVTIRDCGTIIKRNLYGGGNAAPVHATNTTMWGGYVWGNVFGGGNGEDPTKNANGAQVGFKSDDATAAGTGQAVTNIFGGTIGTWTDGVCATNTGGIFGGSNTNGNIRGGIEMTVDGRKSSETGASQCDILFKEIYGAGNLAAYMGSGITFNLGCVENMDEVYGGAKQADLKANVTLNLTSGHIKKVFGGNNISGALDGTITVNIDETGCFPVKIDNLYLGGNQAAYSVYGYNTDGTVKTTGDAKADPVLNIVSCTNIGRVFGGGLGETATTVGNPVVNVNMIKGAPNGVAAAQVGTIGTIFGGGDAAPVQGSTTINIGTEANAAHITGDDKTTEQAVQNHITGDVFGGGLGETAVVTGGTNVTIEGDTNVEGNVYGGGNAAEVKGTTNVQIGEECP